MVKKEVVEKVANLQSEMSSLTQEKIQEVAPKAIEKGLELSMKERAKIENAQYIEPSRKLKAIGELKAEWRPKRERDWEYVKGIFQNENEGGRINNEPKKFWFRKWPGDPDCLWEIPVNVPVYVPRMIAKLLSGEQDEDTGIQAMKFHTFDFVDQPVNNFRPDSFTHEFRPTGTHYTGKFSPLGAF